MEYRRRAQEVRPFSCHEAQEAEMSEDTAERKTRQEWESERAAMMASKTVSELASKVAGLEYDLRLKREENTALQARVPQEGAVVLSKADAERWAAYQALGKPDELKTALDDRDALRADVAARTRRDGAREAAEAEGYKPNVLERLIPPDATLSAREVEENGQKRRAGFIALADGSERPLTEYVSSDLADYLPALRRDAEQTQPPAPIPAPTQQTTTTPSRPLTDVERAAKIRASTDVSF